MSNVIELPVYTKLDLTPDRVLDGNKGSLTEVVLMGYDKDGEFVFCSNKADARDVLWMLEKAKSILLSE